jgi:hypothetical protein
MSNLKFLKESSLNRLQANITANLSQYQKESPWLDAYFSGSNYCLDSNLQTAQALTLKIPDSKKDFFDLENTRIVYSALRHLTPVQASDPRLWTYLTHVSHWDYMRKRWPAEQYVEGDKFKENIQTRYLFMSDRSRALTRNGLARLWWYGYCSYDETRADPFELTGVLLKNLDVTQSILERAFSRNGKVTKAMLGALLDRELSGNPFYVREKVREVAKYLVQVGGVIIIDALNEPELRTLVTDKIEQLSEAA